ncbi:MAG: dipeptide epimerase [Rhodobacteraceae bacterium]|nr:dipeptide epimerase [Paracoccaceae bacterium]MCY4251020.1 dipeptide epimerase [Paracoccaceae bacterium]MCY4307335.1 dipeptide epimerase [Paracoccaceae bacterium]
MKITIKENSFKLTQPFTISRGSRSHAHVLSVEIEDEGMVGWGECVPYERYGETLESVSETIKGVNQPFDRETLQDAVAPGAARNALDCALWDLESKKYNTPVWQLAGLNSLQPLITAVTISLGTPEAMYQDALANKDRPLLKVKLGGKGDIPRIEAIHQAAPNSKLIVDANESCQENDFPDLIAKLLELDVAMVEQPFPADQDHFLMDYKSPIPICADESCHDCNSLDDLVGKYDMINIKLDKTGGLTEALKLLAKGKEMGFDIMVGCMVGSSLAMAPAMLVAQHASIVDLDGPLFLVEDRKHGLAFKRSMVFPPESMLWG